MKKKPVVITVAVPAPLRKTFEYLLPEQCAGDEVLPGMRVRVPFGRGRSVGVVEAVSGQASYDLARLKPIEAVLDDAPVLPGDLLQLCRWASQYYHHPLGEVYATAQPVLLRQGEKAQASVERVWRVSESGRQQDPASLKRAPRQAMLFQKLRLHPEGLGRAQLEDHPGDWQGALRQLESKGLVEVVERPHEAVTIQNQPENSLTLNPEQHQAVDLIRGQLDQFYAFLLHGVTGSGKTEVYLQCIDTVLQRGRQVLVLVPEIGLTPQLVSRFRRRFPVQIALLHSALSDQERLNAWVAAREGRAQIIIGTRSAVFTPMLNPGLIIIDEEHDVSLKQQEGLRYSARDLAVMRARFVGIPIVLGSATPSLESMHNVQTGRYRLLDLPERAGCAVHPRMALLDVRGQAMDEGLSVGLVERMRMHLEGEGQVLLFLNRRGFAPTLLCHDCGWVAECHRCDSHMTLHQSQGKLRCHHCGAERRIETHCKDCGSADLRAVGQGTERTEQALERIFPRYPVARIDRDTTRRKGSMEKMLQKAQDGELRILLGTQLLAKGHHFPGVTLVGILDSDHWLFSSDFRASERMAQLLLQVSGRAGRAERPGEVLIQTHHPDHPLLQTLLRQDYNRFADQAMQERKLAGLPPYGYMALIRAEATARGLPMDFLQQVSRLAHEARPGAVQVLGPVPSPMEKRAGRYRAQLLLQSTQRADLHQLLGGLVNSLESLPAARKVRWSLDVDPQDMY